MESIDPAYGCEMCEYTEVVSVVSPGWGDS